MRTTRGIQIVKATLALFVAGLAVTTLFFMGLAVRTAFGAPDRATVTVRFHRMAVRGQVHRFRDAAVTIRRQRTELRKLRRQVQVRFVRDTLYSIRLAADLFGVSEAALRSVVNCETGGTFSPFAYNHSSGASGALQFLRSTWANQGLPRFSVFDPVANVLAGARIVAQQGWRQWQCRP